MQKVPRIKYFRITGTKIGELQAENEFFKLRLGKKCWKLFKKWLYFKHNLQK